MNRQIGPIWGVRRFTGLWGNRSDGSLGGRLGASVFIKGDPCSNEFFIRNVGQEHVHLRPWEQEVRGLPFQFRAVEAKNTPRSPAEHHLLLLDDGRLRIPKSLGVHALCGKEREVEVPKFKAFLGRFTEESGLEMEELTSELEDLHAGNRGEHFPDGEV